jgi:hypothetical protein
VAVGSFVESSDNYSAGLLCQLNSVSVRHDCLDVGWPVRSRAPCSQTRWISCV